MANINKMIWKKVELVGGDGIDETGDEIWHAEVLGLLQDTCATISSQQLSLLFDFCFRFAKHDTYEDADKSGKKTCKNTHEEPSTLKSKYIQRPVKAAVKFAEKFDGRYDLAHNNCQTFAEGLYSKLWLL